MEGGSSTMTRVQSIVETGATVVPREYVQPVHARPQIIESSSSSSSSLPLIDLSKSNINSKIGSACRDWGAFHVINHGVDVQLLHQIRKVGRTFFEESSMDDKLIYSCDPNSPASQGYGSKMLVASSSSSTNNDNHNYNLVLDWRDYFDHHTLPLSRRDPSRWPYFPPTYREVVAEYGDQIKVLAQKLLRLISESLGLPSSCIEEAVGELYQNITISYYPPCPQPELTLGLQSHSDMGAITLLIQDDVGGLEVLKDGEWITVEPLDDAIFVILADQTEVITNGQYGSAVHRAVTNRSRARVSVATFHDPAKTREIKPAFELEPPKYRPVCYGDYVKSWYTKGPEGKRNIDALLLL